MSTRFVSPFAAPKNPIPASPSPAPAPAVHEAPARSYEAYEPPEGTLAEQVAAYLRETLDERGKAALAKAADLTPNTIVRCLSGTGLKVSTLEKIAQAQGWQIEVRASDGQVFARR